MQGRLSGLLPLLVSLKEVTASCERRLPCIWSEERSILITRDGKHPTQQAWPSPPVTAFSSYSSPNPVCSAKSLQSCLTLCNPVGYSPPGSSVHGILQQEYWRGLPCPPPGDLPDPRIEPTSLTSPALAGGSLLRVPPGKPSLHHISLSHLSSSSLV